MPKGLYARALIIIIAPIVVLEGVIAFVFMERHWQTVTRRLSEATARDIAALIDIYESLDAQDEYDEIIRDRARPAQPSMQILPPGDLPDAAARSRSSICSTGRSRDEIRARSSARSGSTRSASRATSRSASSIADAILRFLAARTQTYASNSHIFLLWMVGSSVILLTVAILFLRNQIRPILRLAEAVDAFGKGRPVPDDFRRAARARCGRRRPRSSRCATASASTSSSARPCWPASATTCERC